MPYKRTSIFNENTLPVGLRREHRTRPGVKVRRHDLQRYSRIISSFLARLPFGAMLRLLQDGQRSGGLMGDRGVAEVWSVLRGIGVYSTAGFCGHEFARRATGGQVTNLQADGGCRAVADMKDAELKKDTAARGLPPRSRAVVPGMKLPVGARPALPARSARRNHYFFFVIFIFGNFRLTAATTEACSGLPELLAKASRA